MDLDMPGGTLAQMNGTNLLPPKAGQGDRLSHPRWMSHLAGNRRHHLSGERRTAGARPADGGTRVPANNQTLRPDKGRDYTERGGAHPAVTVRFLCCVAVARARTNRQRLWLVFLTSPVPTLLPRRIARKLKTSPKKARISQRRRRKCTSRSSE
jgi:hypothetical protein